MAQPPALVDDAVGEILLRLPPDDPALLVRASLVCKSWRRLLTDAAFLRRYRRFHRVPPMLGLLRNTDDSIARFVPTGSFRPRDPDHRDCRVLDCRHGRALLYDLIAMEFLVWDPISGEEREISDGADFSCSSFSATLLCAAADCHHLDCHDGSFLIVFVGTDVSSLGWFAHACVFSSEACEWSSPSTVEVDHYMDMRPPVLVEDSLYFLCEDGIVILRYNLRGERGLSAIDGPRSYHDGVALIPNETSGLGLAGLGDYSLHLWSLETVRPNGVAMWSRFMLIELDTLLPDAHPMYPSFLIGFAKAPGSDVIFVSTAVGVFMVGLDSHTVKKVCERGSGCTESHTIFPYMSFFTLAVALWEGCDGLNDLVISCWKTVPRQAQIHHPEHGAAFILETSHFEVFVICWVV
ncbi:hypothetical protein ACP70R_048365 [Stipagrostis hirtigluma subsp. patula]